MQLTNKNNIEYNELLALLKEADNSFNPKLSEQTELSSYAQKLVDKGFTITTLINNKIVGIISGYINNEQSKEAFISLVYVEEKYRKQNVEI